MPRVHDNVLKNEEKGKCLKVMDESFEPYQCGPTGQVKFITSTNPDPTNAKLLRNPGSQSDNVKKTDGCGPLLAEPVEFLFAKNTPVSDLYLT